MKTFKYKIQDPVGMHARPAAKLVQELTQFKSNFTISLDGKSVNARSIINLMSLGIKSESEITVTVEGEDEDAACEKLPDIFKKHKI